jgi:hypothetical protein
MKSKPHSETHMPVNNRLADRADAIKEWRRHLHQNPEIMYEVQETAAFVAEKLRAFGCDEVVEGLGRTGVVGIIKGSQRGTGRQWVFAPTWMHCRSKKKPACRTPPPNPA